jgi:hypothetical protein
MSVSNQLTKQIEHEISHTKVARMLNATGEQVLFQLGQKSLARIIDMDEQFE